MEKIQNNLSETVISGSLRKHREEIIEVKQNFEKFNIRVLAPKEIEDQIINNGSSFVRFETNDPNLHNSEIEKGFMKNIGESKFLYVANINGYIGKSAGTEIAYAGLKNIPIVLSEKIQQFSEEIPEKAHDIIEKLILDYLPNNNINEKNVKILKEKLENYKSIDISPSQKSILLGMIKNLLRELQNKKD